MNQPNTDGREPRRVRPFVVALILLVLVAISFSDKGKRIVNADDESKFLTRAPRNSVADSAIKPASNLGNTTVTFQEGVSGYAGTRDTYINHVSPATVRGAENLIIQDKNPSTVPPDERTSLLQFDLSAIPTNSTIVSAQLDFYVDSEGQGFNMYRMKVPWNEATASFASIGNRHFMPEGIDAEIPISAAWPGVDGYVGPITVAVPPLQISDWVNGVMTNNGWLMTSAHNDDGVQSRSSEHATIANRPKLTVVYNETPPNFAPASPVVVAPPDDATGVSTSPNLEVGVADPNADSMSVTYYGRPVSTVVPGADFTVIAMPDTQHYVDNGGANAANFYAQTQWIVANKDALNIRFVTGLGDIVENGNTFDSEWQIATNAYSTIEDPVTTNLPDGIPFGLAVGNHDQTPNGGGDTASTTKYNQYFGTSRFAGRAYYGGSYGADNDNHYQFFSGGGMDFIIIHLEYDTTPLAAVLTWADNLLQTHSNRRAIVTTHWMLGMGMPGPFGAQGAAIYNELKDRPNLFMLLGGHVHTEGRRQDTFEGRTVHGILSDYQARTNGGDGWLRIMTFSPANNTISVKTYSPTLGQFETDYDSQFTLPYDMSGSPPFAVIGTNTGVPSGTNTSLNWPGLTAGTQYEWYATVSDGTLTTTGPVRSFTTGPAATPTNTATNTPTNTATSTPTNTPTNTPTPITYTVIYDGNGNTGGTAPVDPNSPYNDGSTVGVLGPGTLEKTGYQFGGWNTVANGSGTRYTPAQAFIINSNTTLHAEWILPPCFQSGSLDPSFDGDGKVITVFQGLGDEAAAVAVQPDGKIVVAGQSYNGANGDFALARYNIDGSLDATFDGDGKVVSDIAGSSDGVISVMIQADGKIVVAGYSFNGSNYDFAVGRYNSDGSLDPTFDVDGVVTTDLMNSSNDYAHSVVIQPNGKIVVGGFTYPQFGGQEDFALVRYNSDGSLDTTFGGDGKVVTDIQGSSERAQSIATQSDGKIVAAGYMPNGPSLDFVLVRYNADGSLDTTFDGDGKVITDFLGGADIANSVVIQPDGKIVAAGHANEPGYTYVALARYNPNGSLDTTFDGDGKVTTDGAYATSVATQPDGKIVAAGASSNGSSWEFVLVRYNVNGSLDSTFDGDGKVTTFFLGSQDQASSVAVQPDGKTIAAGVTLNGSNWNIALARYGVPCAISTPNNTPTLTATNTPTATPTSTPTPPAVISGTVTYANAAAPRYVSNVVMSGVGSPGVSGTTDFPGGNYSLTGFGSGSYTVTPSKAGVADGSVSSFDAARIAQFVVGLATFSPVQQTVAEVSGNGSVSAFDASLVAAYSVGLDGASTGSWKFSPVNRTYPSITSDITGENYLAMLMGEVSGNWQNSAGRAVVGSRLSVVSEESVGSAAAPTYLRRSSASLELSHGDSVAMAPAAEPQGSDWQASEKHSFSANRTAEPKKSAGTARVEVELPTLVAPDKEIVVPVTVQGVAAKGIISYEFDLRYDPSVVQPLDNPVDVAGTVSRGLFTLANADDPGLLRVVVYGPMPIESDGVLLNLRFEAVGAKGSSSALVFERIIFNEGEPDVLVPDGRVEIF